MSAGRFKTVAAVYVIFIQDGQVLLLRRSNTGYEDGKYSLPAGHLDGDEPVRAAAAREAREETGIDIDPEDLEVVHVLHRFTPATGSAPSDEYVDFFFTATQWAEAPCIMEPDKCDELRWADIRDLPGLTIPYIRHVIEQVLQGKTFSEYGWLPTSSEASR